MPIKFDVVAGETEHISFNGKRTRRPTVLMRVRTTTGSIALSRKAFILGASLAACQVVDGILTYLGLRLLGIHMEGNGILRELMHVYGMVPALFAAKLAALILAGILVFHAHKRKWIRPIIFMLVITYMALAVVPWILIISKG